MNVLIKENLREINNILRKYINIIVQGYPQKMRL